MRIPALLVLATTLAAAPPELSALIRYTQRVHTPDGMTKETRFQEQLVRTRNQVWQARVLPAAQAHAHEEDEAHGHLHPGDLATAARHLTRQPDGSLTLAFVKPEDHVIIAADPRDYPEVGFDGSWEAAFHLVDPASLKAMTRRPGPRGATWYEQKGPRQFLRVLWDARHQLPLCIESGTHDGTRFTRTEVLPRPLPARLPWAETVGFAKKDYVDLLD